MNLRSKIISWDHLARWRSELRSVGKRLVVTNGCFDILHAGHVLYLEHARSLGDLLLVGVTGDGSVRELKGPGRPVNNQEDRALVLAALESVTGVCIFKDRDATHFLSVAEPDVYVKGGDYTIETVNQEERKVIERRGGRVEILPVVPGKSTSAILKRLSCLD